MGGGHTHALVLRDLARSGQLFENATLINPSRFAVYSGSLAGHIGGHLPKSEVLIDLAKLCDRAKVSLLEDEIIEWNYREQQLKLKSNRTLEYATLSLNVGGESSEIPRAPDSPPVFPVKPSNQFLQALPEIEKLLLRSNKEEPLLIAGGGAAGVELALNLEARARRQKYAAHLMIVDPLGVLPSAPFMTRRRAERILKDRKISFVGGDSILRMERQGARFRSNLLQPVVAVINALSIKAPTWILRTGLPMHRGRLSISDTLESSLPQVFGSGDLACSPQNPAPASGVYAVRQAPILLQRLLNGATKPYLPQKRALVLIGDGFERAFGWWGPVSIPTGRWVWDWKRKLDGDFMRSFY